MLRTGGDQPTLWESLLPPAALVMPVELDRVDLVLTDDRFIAPFAQFFDATLGRSSIPIQASDLSLAAIATLLRVLPGKVPRAAAPFSPPGPGLAN